MARQTTVTLTDDIDGGKAAESVSFGLDGAHYEIDLSAKNAKALRKAVSEFAEAGRQITPSALAAGTGRQTRRSATPTQSGRTDKSELIAIRTWAAENDVQVAVRGASPRRSRRNTRPPSASSFPANAPGGTRQMRRVLPGVACRWKTPVCLRI